MSERTAVIIGAGPAGLTAAYDCLVRAGIRPVVLELSDQMGGISRTSVYRGNRIDIGGHRFFSKSDRVMQRWFELMPVQGPDPGPDPEAVDRVFLVRRRKSRIYFNRKLFSYPVRLDLGTLRRLGPLTTLRIGFSYLRAVLLPIRRPQNLEQFFINRFGRALYRMFFKSYTEKVWGVPCTSISPEWGGQRVKGLSITAAVVHFLRQLLGVKDRDLAQKQSETSLIEQFLYPKYGPGQLWEIVADEIKERGGQVLTDRRVIRLHTHGQRVVAVEAAHRQTGEVERYEADFFFSSMPVRELVAGLQPAAPAGVREIAAGLVYRDFLTVGLLLERLVLPGEGSGLPQDCWIYIHQPDVRVGRLQIFNNWSPYLVADQSKVWVGIEFFCNRGDELWSLSDTELIELASRELVRLALAAPEHVLDGTVIRVPYAYPAYFGTYDRFSEVRAFLDGFENLFLVGRNGMHRYNNQDHSMLTAMVAVDNIINGTADKANLWAVNTEEEYHEEQAG